jgi:hypothetical protein
LSNFNGKEEIDLSNIKDVEIYLLRTDIKKQNSFYIKASESDQKLLLKNYKSSQDIPTEKCSYYIDLENCKIEKKPFLNKNDIIKFDWYKSKIQLTESGIKKLNAKEIPLKGLAFIIRLNGKNVYGGWFWNLFSSFSCDRIYTYPNLDKNNELDLKFGLGDFKCGKDIRKDESLIRKIIE